jgi:hypothetical protein
VKNVLDENVSVEDTRALCIAVYLTKTDPTIGLSIPGTKPFGTNRMTKRSIELPLSRQMFFKDIQKRVLALSSPS